MAELSLFKFKLSKAAFAASNKLVPPPDFILVNLLNWFFCISLLFDNSNIFWVFSLNVIKLILSFESSIIDTNLVKASFAKSNLVFVSYSSVQNIEPDISKAIDKSIGSLLPIPSYLDFNINPKNASFLYVKGFVVIAWDISKFCTRFFSGEYILK